MKFRMFSEGPIGEEETFVVILQQRVKSSDGIHYGHVGEIEISGRELKQVLATLHSFFDDPTVIPTIKLVEAKEENVNEDKHSRR